MPERQRLTFEEMCELEDRTTEAILLGFNEPLYPFDKTYVIPSPHMIQDFVQKAIRGVNLQERVDEGWESVTRRGVAGPEQSTNCFEDYFMPLFGQGKLDWQWFLGYGDLFRFREDEREKVRESMESYWTQEELRNFQEINKLTQEMAVKYYKDK